MLLEGASLSFFSLLVSDSKILPLLLILQDCRIVTTHKAWRLGNIIGSLAHLKALSISHHDQYVHAYTALLQSLSKAPNALFLSKASNALFLELKELNCACLNAVGLQAVCRFPSLESLSFRIGPRGADALQLQPLSFLLKLKCLSITSSVNWQVLDLTSVLPHLRLSTLRLDSAADIYPPFPLPPALFASMPLSLKRLRLEVFKAPDLCRYLETIVAGQGLPALSLLHVEEVVFGDVGLPEARELGLSVAARLSALPSFKLIIDRVFCAPSLYSVFEFFQYLPDQAQQLLSAHISPLEAADHPAPVIIAPTDMTRLATLCPYLEGKSFHTGGLAAQPCLLLCSERKGVCLEHTLIINPPFPSCRLGFARRFLRRHGGVFG